MPQLRIEPETKAALIGRTIKAINKNYIVLDDSTAIMLTDTTIEELNEHYCNQEVEELNYEKD